MKKIIILFFISLTVLFSCTEKDPIPQDKEVQNFIWKGLNLYYLWQEDVPDLADNKFQNQSSLNAYLEGKDPNTLFESLLFDRGTTDRFSWIVDDYVALENSFVGVSTTNGMEFGLKRINGSDDLFGYVRYILPGSNAELNGVTRGQIFYAINGTNLTVDNYKSLLFSSSNTYQVNFADYTNINNVATITPNGNSIELTKEELTENPIFNTSTNTIDGHKIGYLMYNQFNANYDEELNQVFANFSSENISDLVLDLRYNGGGSVNTAASLCSMITGQFNGEHLYSTQWNSKLNSLYGGNKNFPSSIRTGETIHSLHLSKIYVLISGSTASASEFIINNLSPYINVVLIGTKTIGKNEASITLYDSDNYGRENVNPNHTYAMQPLVLSIKNKLGQSDSNGYTPSIEFPEDYSNLGILGSVTEPLFEQAINQITSTRKNRIKAPYIKDFNNSKQFNYAANNMYLKL